MAMNYTVTVTDWTQSRGYARSGGVWRVRCFALPDDDLNALGRTVFEQFYRNKPAALQAAHDIAKTFGATVLP